MNGRKRDIQLSKRLQAVADLAGKSRCLADIGTDHAFLPVYLVEQGFAERAIALDVNQGPLQRAREHIRVHGLENRIETRLSDGGVALRPGEADTVVIAGMGGALTLRILRDRPEVFLQAEKLVLQPQSEIAEVRKTLQEMGYRISRETMVEEDGKYYPMMLVIPGAQEPWTETECAYGKYLIESADPVLGEFLIREERICRQVLGALERAEGARGAARREEIRERLAQIREARDRMACNTGRKISRMES